MHRLFAAALGAALITLAPGWTPDAQAQKNTLSFGMALEPPHLDPTAGAAAAIDEVVLYNVFETLTRIGPDGGVGPGLARSWTVSDDGQTYTFSLADGVVFHDGTPLTSADVAFSFDRARAEDSVNAQKRIFSAIDTIDTPDDHTVVLTLSRPDGLLLFNLGQGDASIVSPGSVEGNKQTPIGTGAYRFVRWIPGDRVLLERNDAYWGTAPAMERVSVRFIADAPAQAAALLSGDLDAFPNMGAPELLPQLEADPRYTVIVGTTEGETILSINNAREPFNDIRVRRAIQHAIDRQAVIDGAMSGLGTPIGSHFAPHQPAYVDLTGRYPYDPDAARALLAEAGYADGFEATLKLPPPTYARRGGEIVAAQLRDVGIELEIIPVEWAQWLEQVLRATDYDLTIVSHTEPLDVEIYGRDNYYFNYHSDVVRGLLSDLDATIDPDGRAALYGDIQRTLAEDAVNGFIFELAKAGVFANGLTGMWSNAPIQVNDVTAARWE